MAKTTDTNSIDRTVLPPPDPPFRGKIEVAYKDSKGEFPEPLRAPKGAPNVLLIMGDDIGYGHMSAFGGPANTPTFDRLAKQGLSFTNFHTTAVCAASRAALLTGRNAHSVGMGGVPEAAVGFPGYNAIIPRSAATVLEILRQNGYGTAWIGKTHLTPLHEITRRRTVRPLAERHGRRILLRLLRPRREPVVSAALGEHDADAGRRKRRKRAITWRPTWPTRPSA